MINDILNAANQYARGLKNVESRHSQWLEKYKEVHDRLEEIAAQLNEKAEYKPGYFVDISHAFNEEINGTCAKMPAVTFRSGTMPMKVSFKSASGEKTDYMEEGFRLSFRPTVTGQVAVLLLPHDSTIDSEKPQEVTIAVIDKPSALTVGNVDEIVLKAMKMAFYTSFTGMVELQEEEINSTQRKYSPIGFKRFESTEKVK